METINSASEKVNPQKQAVVQNAIKTEEENDRAITIVEKLSKGDKISSEETALLELLGKLIADFEAKFYEPREASPQEVLVEMMNARGHLSADDEKKFFVDVNAARLARLLRAAGFNAAWEDGIPDADLVRRAIRERRVVLTLDKRLARERRADNVLLLESEKPLEQLRQIVERFELKTPPGFSTRCLICNQALQAASAEEIAMSKVPPRVRASHAQFYRCPRCAKIYWEGSHARRMRAALEEIFNRA